MNRCALVLALLFASHAHGIEFKIATVSPDGSAWMRELRDSAADIYEHTEGRVRFKFYPGGVMGDDQIVLQKVRLGQLHGFVTTSGGLAKVYPDIQLYNLPMQFRSFAEVDYVRSRMDDLLVEGLANRGYIALGIAEVGFAYAMSKVPFRTVAEVQRLRAWAPAGDVAAERTLAAFGISPIPLSLADVLSGLQTGLIDAVTAPPVAAIALQWHTQLNEVLDLPLLYVYGTFAISERQFAKLAPADQAYIRKVMGDAVSAVALKNRGDHQRAVEVLRQQGLSWNRPSESELATWNSYATQASTKLVDAGTVSSQLYDVLVDRLAAVRRLQ